jgi:deoxycytidine triphosphate deaminase
MVLSDVDIIERIASGDLVIDPYEEDNVEPASIDIRLGSSFKEPVKTGRIVDSRSDDGQPYRKFEADSIVLEPGDSYLATTLETIELPNDLCADAVGRSSLGRLFVSVHETAGFCDPGFCGEVTLEMTNENPNPVRLHAGDRVCQLVFKQLSSPAVRPYGHDKSQYQDQTDATESGMQFE